MPDESELRAMRAADTGGYYCTACGYTTQRLPAGFVTCWRCGHLGLRGFDRAPKRVGCPHNGCDFQGWDDGGVNDDLGRHLRRDHPSGPQPEAP